ncbi:hypothetical protein DE146DRAFT_284339 [Phaeosphaeria sp. MPI-PUGE-AT-0046c]|nr:hypothetical protein DE146DRAFT_284339 [Phaeosphaeria sp. MPI-PUGE-AT-0046c]
MLLPPRFAARLMSSLLSMLISRLTRPADAMADHTRVLSRRGAPHVCHPTRRRESHMLVMGVVLSRLSTGTAAAVLTIDMEQRRMRDEVKQTPCWLLVQDGSHRVQKCPYRCPDPIFSTLTIEPDQHTWPHLPLPRLDPRGTSIQYMHITAHGTQYPCT